ncbi:ethanolamine kinase 1-like [Paramacrobiotus metropolitanus]|uniref:ethanolamine kinase 1-like n=1 Tax=Paramacrobiotus metropolitanus TaxID=2943436 RepID=UPI002445F7A6|nr:ethanolamine kinase 1-like [Paramacrobiotus metropolitanus]
MASLPRTSFNFDHYDPEASVRTILQHFRPDWFERLESERLKIEDVTGGYTNKLVVVYFDEDPLEKILIRIHGEDTGKNIDRKAELRTLQILWEICGKVYGVFGNGMCYEYVKGEALEQEMTADPHISMLIIEKLLKIGAIALHLPSEGIPSAHFLFDKLHTMLRQSPKTFSDPTTENTFRSLNFPNHKYFEAEVNFLQTVHESNVSPEVFCHNDLFYRNILYDEDADQIRFIDFEYAGLNYQAYDIGNHFNEWCGVDDVDYSRYPSREVQMVWLRYYLQCWHHAHGREEETVDEEEVERMYLTVNRFALVAHLFWIIWSFQQAESSSIEFDYLTYGKKRLDEYQKRKAVLF